MKHAYVIRHLAFEDLGSLEPALQEQGYILRYFEAGMDDVSMIAHDGPALLIVLGGPIGVYENAIYPFLDDEITVIRDRLKKKQPVIGICLGAQLMAASLGAKVYPGHVKEIGWSALQTPTGAPAPEKNPLAVLLENQVEVLHWHGDTFALPEGVTHLASSALYPNQAFAVGNYGLALQFHAEVVASNIERWLIGHAGELAAARIDIPALRAISAEQAPVLQKAATALWKQWLTHL
jgi:GMP synthase (glutamine-hydrolysing)